MDSELDPTIAALQSNVLACREVADLALLSAEQLEQLAHTLEREAWQARGQVLPGDASDLSRLTETEQRLLSTLTGTCGAWVRLMRVYCGNVEAAFVANPRLAAALPADSPLHALAAFWTDVDERLKHLLQRAAETRIASRSSSRETLPTLPVAAALGRGSTRQGH